MALSGRRLRVGWLAAAWSGRPPALPVLKRAVPLPRLVRLMAGRRSPGPASDAVVVTTLRLARAYRRRVPGADNCLERSLLTYRYLLEAGASPALVCGVDRSVAGVVGHAWVTPRRPADHGPARRRRALRPDRHLRAGGRAVRGLAAAHSATSALLERVLRVQTRGEFLQRDRGFASGVYRPSSWLVLHALFRRLPVAEDDVLVDVGSGMGRVLLVAGAVLRRVIGIEQDPELTRIAERNLRGRRLACRDVELLTVDASAWAVPDDLTMAYLYCPLRTRSCAGSSRRSWPRWTVVRGRSR